MSRQTLLEEAAGIQVVPHEPHDKGQVASDTGVDSTRAEERLACQSSLHSMRRDLRNALARPSLQLAVQRSAVFVSTKPLGSGEVLALESQAHSGFAC